MDIHHASPSVAPASPLASPHRALKLVAEDRDRRRNAHLATVAHEMRNALAPLSSVIEVLSRRPRDDGGRSDMLLIARRQVAQLTTLTEDLLDLGRTVNDQFRLAFAVEPLQPLLQALVDAWRVQGESKHQTISLEVPATPVLVRLDRVRFGQAVQNIIGNALKFTPEGGHIGVKLEAAGSVATVRVSDSGIGIAVEELGNIFALFNRTRTGESDVQGFGIGLALARRLVHLHGGTISASSAGVGLGTSFVISVPLAAHSSGAA